ncbi:hypothetical protein SETIT_J025400v2 [Setaria italica]|uniref:non-specific serine/threonine protein kinase n=1 Tax=Setaria italica TaxID=4555 RepID=A0A368PFI4_SETIT|nr:hypothetical protein SETIT_J025400v2 [Setaria italica]
MSTTKVGCVGNYELGRTIGKGTFAKFKLARNIQTGEFVAIKILDKEKVLKHKMVEQIKRGILAMKLIEHPNIVRIYEPEKLLLDSRGNLKVSEFGLGALSQQIKTDGVLHTTYGTPNYVAPEVLEGGGYDGGTADVWSCGVILFILLARYLPFEDSNLTRLYKKISNAEFTFPLWTSFPAKMLLTRILDTNPITRITIPEILQDEWFKEGYRRQEFDNKYDITTLNDVNAVFQDSKEHLVTEKKDEPVSLDAFDLISSSKGFNLENLLDSEQGFKREERFTSTCPPREIIHRIEEAATTLGFRVQKKNYKLRLEKIEAGKKGNLNVAAEILQIAPSFHVIEVRKGEGDTLEFHKFCKDLSKTLKDIVWKFDDL